MPGEKIEIRRAKSDDLHSLYLIGRESFPESLTYRISFRVWEKWWSFITISPAVEVYVISVQGIPAGAAMLVTDEARYREEYRKHRPGDIAFAGAVLLSPRCLGLLPGKCVDVMKKCRIKNTPSFSLYNLPPAKERTWFESLAVSPRYRGKGLARRFFLFLERRTKVLGRSAIVSFVDRKNAPIVMLHESLKYKRSGGRADGIYYCKYVAGDEGIGQTGEGGNFMERRLS